MGQGKLFILSAPSGTGKTTILKQVMANLPGLSFSVSHTTRKPREGEVDGVDYHFIDKPTFISMKDKKKFLEYAEVHGNFYATSKDAIASEVAAGRDVILDIDVQGAKIIKESGEIKATYIFLTPPDIHELEKRLRSRGLDSDETILIRLNNASKEMESMEDYEYVIVNDDITETIKMFESVILAERSKDRRNFNGAAFQTAGMRY